MSRHKRILSALGGGLALVLSPITLAHAQSGDALANAERTCIDNGVEPDTAGFETCVDRAAVAFDMGDPETAHQQVKMVLKAHQVCQSYGLGSASLGYKQCVAKEIHRRVVDTYQIGYLTNERPHQGIVIDDYGLQYDRNGNLFDPRDYAIHYVPR